MPADGGKGSGYVSSGANGDMRFETFCKGIRSSAADQFRDEILKDPANWGLPSIHPSAHSRSQIRSTLTRRNRISKVAQGPQLKSPLHAKKVQTMHLDRLLRDMQQSVSRRITSLLHGLQNAASGTDEVTARFRAPTKDVIELRQAEAIEEFTGTSFTPVRYFTVYEALKERRRPIMWPWTFLLRSDYTSHFSLESVGNYCQAVHKGNSACAFDLASSFWQVALEKCNFVIVDEDGKKWRITRLPFGVDCASEIMQLIVEELGRLARVQAGLAESDVTLYVHIDNVMCVGSHHEVAKWKRAFVDICESYRVTLNDDPDNEVRQHAEFAGIRFNFRKDGQGKKVRPRDSFIKGIPSFEQACKTFSDLESCVGKLLYGMAIRQMRAHQYHEFIMWWRTCLSSLNRGCYDWESRPAMRSEVAQQLRDMIREVSSDTYVKVPRDVVIKSADELPPDARADTLPILVVDATLSDFGGVLYERGHVVAAYGERFAKRAPSMGVAEISGALGMVRRFADRLRGRTFVLLTDNTSCEIGIRKGKSSHLDMDRAAFAIQALVRDVNARVLVGHVATECNAADAVSRAKPLDEKAIEASKEAAVEAIELLLSGKEGVGAGVKQVIKPLLPPAARVRRGGDMAAPRRARP